MFTRLGKKMYRYRRRVALVWIAVLVLGVTLGSQSFQRATMDQDGPDTEATRAEQRLEDLGATNPDVLGLVDGAAVSDPATKKEVIAARERLMRLPGVAQVADFYATKSPLLIAEDGRATVVAVNFDESLDTAGRERTAEDVESTLRGIDAPRVAVGGPAMLDEEFTAQSEKDLQKAELASLPVVLIVLVVIFGGVVGAGLPLIVALVSVAAAMLMLFALTFLTSVTPYALNVVTMLGLGLAVDYSLLVISRFREKRAQDHIASSAVERTVATAGRTVTFSGLTVAVALSGLLLFDDPLLRSLAYGGILVVIATVAASLTLLPALLAMWGGRLKIKAATSAHGGVFYRLSRFVQRRAVTIVAAMTTVLVVLGLPFLKAELAMSGADSLPPSMETRQVFDTLQSRFSTHGAEPITIVADRPANDPEVATLVSKIEEIDGVQMVTPRPLDAPEDAVIDVLAAGPTQGDTARDVVREIRSIPTPFDKAVGGPAAWLSDYRSALGARIPYALGVIALASFVLLFLMTGSVIVPVKAMLMNVLSLGASFGALVWVFQDGNLSGLLDFEAIGSLDIVIPIVVFVFAFGLSMDYEVFLLSRIKEEYDISADNDHAVAVGLQKTGRIVTSAAILIVTVFLGFTTGELIAIKEMGLGMALAVIVDATIVRMLLVPATMKLMGDLNWWAPRPLRSLYARFGLRERAETISTPALHPVMEEGA